MRRDDVTEDVRLGGKDVRRDDVTKDVRRDDVTRMRGGMMLQRM